MDARRISALLTNKEFVGGIFTLAASEPPSDVADKERYEDALAIAAAHARAHKAPASMQDRADEALGTLLIAYANTYGA